jgi:hypothetical protein
MPQDQQVTVTGDLVRDKFAALIREIHTHTCRGNGCHKERLKPEKPLTEQTIMSWETDLYQIFNALYRS